MVAGGGRRRAPLAVGVPVGAAALGLYVAQEQALGWDQGHLRHEQVHMHIAVVVHLQGQVHVQVTVVIIGVHLNKQVHVHVAVVDHLNRQPNNRRASPPLPTLRKCNSPRPKGFPAAPCTLCKCGGRLPTKISLLKPQLEKLGNSTCDAVLLRTSSTPGHPLESPCPYRRCHSAAAILQKKIRSQEQEAAGPAR